MIAPPTALPTKTFHEGDIDAEDAQCVVCLEEYHEGDSYKRLPCRHHFHTSCIDEWLRLNDRCARTPWPLRTILWAWPTSLAPFSFPLPFACTSCPLCLRKISDPAPPTPAAADAAGASSAAGTGATTQTASVPSAQTPPHRDRSATLPLWATGNAPSSPSQQHLLGDADDDTPL